MYPKCEHNFSSATHGMSVLICAWVYACQFSVCMYECPWVLVSRDMYVVFVLTLMHKIT